MRKQIRKFKITGSCPLFLILASLTFLPAAQAKVEEGQAVPGFTLEKKGGGTFTYPQDGAGKVIFLNFWAEWCTECKIELPELQKIKKKYENKPFEMLAVNTDRKQKIADRFLKKIKVDMVVLYDKGQKLIKTFQPVGIPASYLIRPDGKVEKIYISFKMDYIDKYIADIDRLLSEK